MLIFKIIFGLLLWFILGCSIIALPFGLLILWAKQYEEIRRYNEQKNN